MTDSIDSPLDAHDFDRFARFYDQDYRLYDDDIPLLLTLADQANGPILELGSGTGRALLPLAMQGHQVTGIDISPALHEIARKKIHAAGAARNVDLIQGDMRSVTLPQMDYALAYSVSNTLMHCTTQADQLAVMHTAFSHLRSGGSFLVDLFNPDIPHLLRVENITELADSWIDEQRGTHILKWCVRSVDIAAQLQETLFIYEEHQPNGASTRTLCPFTLRFLWRSEGELLLKAAGFNVEAVWGDFDGSEYGSESQRLIFVARKP